MKETKEKFNYIWLCSEIGKVKREIRENERLLEFLEKNRLIYEKKLIKGNEKTKEVKR